MPVSGLMDVNETNFVSRRFTGRMERRRSVLVAVNAGKHSTGALDWTLQSELFSVESSNFHVVTVLPRQPAVPPSKTSSLLEYAENLILEKRPNAKKNENYSLENLFGDVSLLISEYVASKKIDVLVLGEKNPLDEDGTRWSRTCLEMIRLAPCALVVVRASPFLGDFKGPLIECFQSTKASAIPALSLTWSAAKTDKENGQLQKGTTEPRASSDSCLSPESSSEEERRLLSKGEDYSANADPKEKGFSKEKKAPDTLTKRAADCKKALISDGAAKHLPSLNGHEGLLPPRLASQIEHEEVPATDKGNASLDKKSPEIADKRFLLNTKLPKVDKEAEDGGQRSGSASDASLSTADGETIKKVNTGTTPVDKRPNTTSDNSSNHLPDSYSVRENGAASVTDAEKSIAENPKSLAEENNHTQNNTAPLSVSRLRALFTGKISTLSEPSPPINPRKSPPSEAKSIPKFSPNFGDVSSSGELSSSPTLAVASTADGLTTGRPVRGSQIPVPDKDERKAFDQSSEKSSSGAATASNTDTQPRLEKIAVDNMEIPQSYKAQTIAGKVVEDQPKRHIFGTVSVDKDSLMSKVGESLPFEFIADGSQKNRFEKLVSSARQHDDARGVTPNEPKRLRSFSSKELASDGKFAPYNLTHSSPTLVESFGDKRASLLFSNTLTESSDSAKSSPASVLPKLPTVIDSSLVSHTQRDTQNAARLISPSDSLKEEYADRSATPILPHSVSSVFDHPKDSQKMVALDSRNNLSTDERGSAKFLQSASVGSSKEKTYSVASLALSDSNIPKNLFSDDGRSLQPVRRIRGDQGRLSQGSGESLISSLGKSTSHTLLGEIISPSTICSSSDSAQLKDTKIFDSKAAELGSSDLKTKTVSEKHMPQQQPPENELALLLENKRKSLRSPPIISIKSFPSKDSTGEKHDLPPKNSFSVSKSEPQPNSKEELTRIDKVPPQLSTAEEPMAGFLPPVVSLSRLSQSQSENIDRQPSTDAHLLSPTKISPEQVLPDENSARTAPASEDFQGNKSKAGLFGKMFGDQSAHQMMKTTTDSKHDAGTRLSKAPAGLPTLNHQKLLEGIGESKPKTTDSHYFVPKALGTPSSGKSGQLYDEPAAVFPQYFTQCLNEQEKLPENDPISCIQSVKIEAPISAQRLQTTAPWESPSSLSFKASYQAKSDELMPGKSSAVTGISAHESAIHSSSPDTINSAVPAKLHQDLSFKKHLNRIDAIDMAELTSDRSIKPSNSNFSPKEMNHLEPNAITPEMNLNRPDGAELAVNSPSESKKCKPKTDSSEFIGTRARESLDNSAEVKPTMNATTLDESKAEMNYDGSKEIRPDLAVAYDSRGGGAVFPALQDAHPAFTNLSSFVDKACKHAQPDEPAIKSTVFTEPPPTSRFSESALDREIPSSGVKDTALGSRYPIAGDAHKSQARFLLADKDAETSFKLNEPPSATANLHYNLEGKAAAFSTKISAVDSNRPQRPQEPFPNQKQAKSNSAALNERKMPAKNSESETSLHSPDRQLENAAQTSTDSSKSSCASKDFVSEPQRGPAPTKTNLQQESPISANFRILPLEAKKEIFQPLQVKLIGDGAGLPRENFPNDSFGGKPSAPSGMESRAKAHAEPQLQKPSLISTGKNEEDEVPEQSTSPIEKIRARMRSRLEGYPSETTAPVAKSDNSHPDEPSKRGKFFFRHLLEKKKSENPADEADHLESQ